MIIAGDHSCAEFVFDTIQQLNTSLDLLIIRVCEALKTILFLLHHIIIIVISNVFNDLERFRVFELYICEAEESRQLQRMRTKHAFRFENQRSLKLHQKDVGTLFFVVNSINEKESR